MIQDIQYRRVSAFTGPEWLSRPFRKHNKGLDQKLYDIGAEVAAIIAGADRLRETPDDEDSTGKRIELLEKCQNLIDRLDAWFERLNEEIPPPHYWPEFSNIRNTIDDIENRKIFPVSFRFSNLLIAKIMLDYWGVSIVLYSTTLMLYRPSMGEVRFRVSQMKPPAAL